MAEIFSFPARSKLRVVDPTEQGTLQQIFLAEHAHLAHAMENIASATLELQALNTIAVHRDTNALGDMVDDAVLISLAKGMNHLLDLRGARNAERAVRHMLSAMISHLEQQE
jgi:hypothetical protein